MELAIWASFILQFRVRNRAGGGDDLRGGDIATENARLGATGPIDLLDTESAIAVRDDLAAPNAQWNHSQPPCPRRCGIVTRLGWLR
jgi:hypothetical protein